MFFGEGVGEFYSRLCDVTEPEVASTIGLAGGKEDQVTPSQVLEK